MKKSIFPTDVIYATVTQRGRVLASIRLIGMSTLGEIFNQVKETISDAMGLVTFSVRNSSQGWVQDRKIMLCPALSR